jgi:hypothetical protein
MPAEQRGGYEVNDNFKLYVDADRDASTGEAGYEYLIRLHGGDPRPFAVEHWEGGGWVDRTPSSFSGSFQNGVHVQLRAADIGISGGGPFNFSIVSVDPATWQPSDKAPANATDGKFTYTR